eukprot:14106465-Alexandrium_andersonii.AAC.1
MESSQRCGCSIGGRTTSSIASRAGLSAKVAAAATSESAQARARLPTATRRWKSARDSGKSGGGTEAEAALAS